MCFDAQQCILLASTLEGDDLRRTLLHEMCHVGLDEGLHHGLRFRRRLRRLGAQGEPLALEECARFDGSAEPPGLPRMGLRDLVRGELQSLALIRPRAQWRTVRRLLANTHAMEPELFEPWGRAEWRLARAGHL